MPDIKRYWHLVAEQRAKLPSEVWLTSIERPLEGITGGATCAVTREIAARRLVEQSHRIATEEEIQKFHADQREREQLCAQLEFRRQREKGGVTVSVTPEQVGLDVLPKAVEAARKGK
jgi:hypothetical protein